MASVPVPGQNKTKHSSAKAVRGTGAYPAMVTRHVSSGRGGGIWGQSLASNTSNMLKLTHN